MKKNLLTNSSSTKSLLLSTMFAIGMLLALIVAILCPLGTIWALNTLFNLQIQYTFWNWLAMVVLIITLQAALKITKHPIKIKHETRID